MAGSFNHAGSFNLLASLNLLLDSRIILTSFRFWLQFWCLSPGLVSGFDSGFWLQFWSLGLAPALVSFSRSGFWFRLWFLAPVLRRCEVLYIWNIHPPLGTRPRAHDPHVTVLSPFRFKEIPPLRYRLLNFKQRVIDRERHGGWIAKLDLGRRLAALVTREFHRLEAQGRYQQDGCL